MPNCFKRIIRNVRLLRHQIGWVAAAVTCVTASPGAYSEVDYRWASEFHHGTTYDSIRSADGAELTVYCSASGDGRSGLMIEANNASFKGLHLFQFVIDGRNYPFEFENGALTFPKITDDTPMSIFNLGLQWISCFKIWRNRNRLRSLSRFQTRNVPGSFLY
jgi:hypothetical protein